MSNVPEKNAVNASNRTRQWQSHPNHKINVERKAARKRELFAEFVTGDVLHLGCGGGGAGRPGEAGWFHEDLDDLADGELVGIDTDEAAVESARDRGYDIRVANATDYQLNTQFDTIAAPNIIEHVGNPQALLASVRNHLRSDGQLLLTTDRMLIPWWLLQMLADGDSPGVHHEHVMHFCKEHLEELLRRERFEVTHYEPWGFNRRGLSAADWAWRLAERALSKLPKLEDIDKVQHFVVAEPID